MLSGLGKLKITFLSPVRRPDILVESDEDAFVAMVEYFPDYAADFCWRDRDGNQSDGPGTSLRVWASAAERERDRDGRRAVAVIENVSGAAMHTSFLPDEIPWLTNRALRALQYAQGSALACNLTEFGPELLVLGVLEEGQSRAAKILSASGVTLQKYRSLVEQSLPSSGRRQPFQRVAPPSPTCLAAIHRAIDGARYRGRKAASAATLLASSLNEPECRNALIAIGVDVPSLHVRLSAEL